mmetsp:Transcript_76311/g.235631  ORF Transcript_76311/g.235631 Transcript_76311/m.235631 type:complete len:262 (+) Transcript_76311:461-1246(+)
MPSAQLNTTSWSFWRLMSACLITLRLTTMALRKALRLSTSWWAVVWRLAPPFMMASSIFLYLKNRLSACATNSQPRFRPSWLSSPSHRSSSVARCSAQWLPRSARPTDWCACRSRNCVDCKTSPFAVAAARTEVRQSMSSSAACRELREVVGTILNTMLRLRCMSPAAESSELPLSFTCFSVVLNTSCVSATSCASADCLSSRSTMALSVSSCIHDCSSSKRSAPDFNASSALGQSQDTCSRSCLASSTPDAMGSTSRSPS